MFDFGKIKGEHIVCMDCKRVHEILRGTSCRCACGEEIRGKHYVPIPILKETKLMFAQRFQNDAEKKYKSKIPEKGDSWTYSPRWFLVSALRHEIKEWEESLDGSPERQYDELIDIRNLASMLGERVKRKIEARDAKD